MTLKPRDEEFIFLADYIHPTLNLLEQMGVNRTALLEMVGVSEAFLEKPDLIRHVHWSDNYLYDQRGRNDSHLSVGKGTLPTEMHRRIKRLDATILLEHFYTFEELAEELEYIDSL